MKVRTWTLTLLAMWVISGCDSGQDTVLTEGPDSEIAAGDVSATVEPDTDGYREEQLRELFDGLEQSATLIESYAQLDEILRPTDGPLLLEAFDGTTHGTKRWILARFMGHVGAEDTAGRLRAMVRNDESEHVRRNAAIALGWLGHEPAVDDLTASVRNDPVAFVQIASAVAIHEILGDRSFPVLSRLLREATNPGVKQSLEWLLDRRFKGTVEPRGRAGQLAEASYKGTRYRFYLPLGYTGDVQIPLIVSVHGSWGFPEPYAEMWIQDANRFGFAVLAPHFDYPTFPGYHALEIGIHGTRSDLRLLDIIEQIGEHHSVETEKFYLFGHSQGGQFVTRFLMAHPNRIHGAVASGAGNYVRWNPDVYFPNGSKDNPLAPDLNDLDFGSLAHAKLGIVLGDQELERRKTAARQFMEDIERYALEHRIRTEIELMWVQNAGHVGAKNQPTASAFLFGR